MTDDWGGFVTAFPNPASATMGLAFRLSRPQHVTVTVRDAEIGVIATLLDEDLDVNVPAGQSTQGFRLDWDLTNSAGLPVSNGIYCVSVVAEEFATTGDVVVDRDFDGDISQYCR